MLILVKKKKIIITHFINDNDVKISNDKNIAQDFNDFFAHVCSESADNI